MNKPKHTSGPWSLDSDGYLWSPSDDQFEVAQVNVYNAADAKLIAAAPEMLEALEEFMLCGPNAGHNQDLIEQVKLAIAKARGDSE